MEEEAVGEGEEKEEVIVLVSPICEPSLEAVREVREWAWRRGLIIREVSALEPEGQGYILDLGISRVPALILGGRLISEGEIRLPDDLK